MFGQFAATTQFYLYGKKHFTRTGWEAATKLYSQPDPLASFNLTGKVYMVTGANQGIGFEIARILANENHTHVILTSRNKGLNPTQSDKHPPKTTIGNNYGFFQSEAPQPSPN